MISYQNEKTLDQYKIELRKALLNIKATRTLSTHESDILRALSLELPVRKE
jgi:hypothetical protein